MQNAPTVDMVDLVTRAGAVVTGVFAKVGPDQSHLSTPCDEWDVETVMQHIVRGTEMTTRMLTEGTAAREMNPLPAAEAPAAFATAQAALLAAANEPGALEKPVTAPFGTMPASAIVGLRALDDFSHAWDIARATGQSTDLDPETAAALLAIAQRFMAGRDRSQSKAFKPEQPVAAGAPPADQLAAFLGRTV